MSKKAKTNSAETLLEKLNKDYLKVHKRYEDLFWKMYMGDHTLQTKFKDAQIARENFRSDEKLSQQVSEAIETASKKNVKKLKQWSWFFSKYQTPTEVKKIFKKISTLENKIHKDRAKRKEGYTDPKTKKFVKASEMQMRELTATHDKEAIRKACYQALERLALSSIKDYVELVKLRNNYAQALGYSDFYAYKAEVEEGMSKKELFTIFDKIYDKTKYAFKEMDKMKKENPGLKKPWNIGYLLAGDFTKESDPYFPFEEALERWGRSFAALGIDFQGSTLQLDLLDRDGKYSNGFCHWPDLVHFKDGKRIPGSSNFTCNVVYGQVGSSEGGYNTLFHEGGHAAHLLNTEETEACVKQRISTCLNSLG